VKISSAKPLEIGPEDKALKIVGARKDEYQTEVAALRTSLQTHHQENLSLTETLKEVVLRHDALKEKVLRMEALIAETDVGRLKTRNKQVKNVHNMLHKHVMGYKQQCQRFNGICIANRKKNIEYRKGSEALQADVLELKVVTRKQIDQLAVYQGGRLDELTKKIIVLENNRNLPSEGRGPPLQQLVGNAVKRNSELSTRKVGGNPFHRVEENMFRYESNSDSIVRLDRERKEEEKKNSDEIARMDKRKKDMELDPFCYESKSDMLARWERERIEDARKKGLVPENIRDLGARFIREAKEEQAKRESTHA